MKIFGGVGLLTISTQRQTNQTLMINLPYNYFKITKISERIYFKLTDAAIAHIRKEFNAEYLGVRYVKRHYFDFDEISHIILIPKVILAYENEIHYHRILPDFIIPFCRHTIKPLIAANTEIQNAEIIDALPVSESDHLIDTVFDNPKRTRYLRSHLNNFIKRVKASLGNLADCRTKLWMKVCDGFEFIRKEYLLTEAGMPIRVISYVRNSLWIGGDP